MSARSRVCGVFCIETPWFIHDDSISEHASLRPLLELIRGVQAPEFRYRYHTCVTRAEFEALLDLWIETDPQDYPLLFLGFHGSRGEVALDPESDERVPIEEIARFLDNEARPRVIYFGGCGTLDVPDSRLSKFLEHSGALAVCGYQNDIEWMQAAAFELLLIDAFQGYSRTVRGVTAADRKLRSTVGNLYETLGFKMHVLPYN